MAFAVVSGLFVPASAEQTRYFEKDGVRYQETRSWQRTPVARVQWQEREETVYVQQPKREVQQYERMAYYPTVSYRRVPRLHDWWNPFSVPYVTLGCVGFFIYRGLKKNSAYFDELNEKDPPT